MIIITMLALMILLIVTIMTVGLNMLAKKSFYDREKFSPFECGFDPKNFARLPFSLHFFLIAIIFVLFDVELTLFLPLVLISESVNLKFLSLITTSFICILLMGVIHELTQGSLNWVS